MLYVENNYFNYWIEKQGSLETVCFFLGLRKNLEVSHHGIMKEFF